MGTAQWALIVSICSSLWSVYSSNKQKKINENNREYDFSKVLYEDILLEDIPKAYEEWSALTNYSGKTDFYKGIRRLRKNSLFFKQRYPKFYKKLEAKLSHLEDLIAGRNNLSDEQLIERNINDISMEVYTLYSLYFEELPKTIRKSNKKR